MVEDLDDEIVTALAGHGVTAVAGAPRRLYVPLALPVLDKPAQPRNHVVRIDVVPIGEESSAPPLLAKRDCATGVKNTKQISLRPRSYLGIKWLWASFHRLALLPQKLARSRRQAAVAPHSGGARPFSERRSCRAWLQWIAGPALVACCLAYHFSGRRSKSVGPPIGRETAYVCCELPRYGLLDGPHNLLVEVFDPASGDWEPRRKDYVKPGEEFKALDILFKQAMHDGLSEIHEEIDVARLDDAVRGFNAQDVRTPTWEDVVYVFGLSHFGGNLRECGFQTLRYVGPGKSFRFLGRLYRTEAASEPNAVRLVDTGRTFAKPGGDPDAGRPDLLLTEYTRKFFPQSRLPKCLQSEDLKP